MYLLTVENILAEISFPELMYCNLKTVLAKPLRCPLHSPSGASQPWHRFHRLQKFYSFSHQFTTNVPLGVINITATRASRGNNSNTAFIRTLSEFRPCAKAMNSCFFLFCLSSALFIPQLIHKAALGYAGVICHSVVFAFSPLCFMLGYVLKVALKERL